jgi:hypothetical protein
MLQLAGLRPSKRKPRKLKHALYLVKTRRLECDDASFPATCLILTSDRD